jgi:hypothetical protein
MNTYELIRLDVKERTGRTVKNCWIAHVKELNQLPRRDAANRQSPDRHVYPCPDWARPYIEAAMRRLGIL